MTRHHARADKLRADKYADPWLKISRYEVLTDDLLKRADEAVNYLKRVVQADGDDTKMGYPIPGDSCLAACIGLEVMRFLDEIGALTERPVADAISSTSGGIPAQVGTDRSVSAPDGALTDAVSKHLTPSEPGQGSSGDRTSSGDERDSPASVRHLGDTASVSAPALDMPKLVNDIVGTAEVLASRDPKEGT